MFFISAACFLPCATSVAVLGPAGWSRAVETGSGPAAFVFHVRGFNDHADRSLGVDWLLKKYTPTRFASLSRSLSQLSSPRVISPLEKEVAPPLSRRKKSTMSEREVPMCAGTQNEYDYAAARVSSFWMAPIGGGGRPTNRLRHTPLRGVATPHKIGTNCVVPSPCSQSSSYRAHTTTNPC